VSVVASARGVKIGQDLEADDNDGLETEENIFEDEDRLEGRALRRGQMADVLSASGKTFPRSFAPDG